MDSQFYSFSSGYTSIVWQGCILQLLFLLTVQFKGTKVLSSQEINLNHGEINIAKIPLGFKFVLFLPSLFFLTLLLKIGRCKYHSSQSVVLALELRNPLALPQHSVFFLLTVHTNSQQNLNLLEFA